MATVTPKTETTEATEIKVSPKLTAAIKDFVNWKQGVETTEGNKLANIRALLTAEKDKGVSKARLNLALLEGGMKAPAASQLLILVFPKTEEAAAELKAAEAHNATLPKGQRGEVVGFSEQVQIARGKSTVAATLEAKAAKADGKRNARPNGNAPATTTTTTTASTVTKMEDVSDAPKFKAAIVRLCELAEKQSLAKGDPEAIGALADEAVDLYVNDETDSEANAEESK